MQMVNFRCKKISLHFVEMENTQKATLYTQPMVGHLWRGKCGLLVKNELTL